MRVVMKMMMVIEIIMVTCASVWLVKTTALHGALWPNAAWSQRGSLPHSTDIPMVQPRPSGNTSPPFMWGSDQ
jgi:hypothetical protein